MEQSANKLCLATIDQPEPSDEEIIAQVLGGEDDCFEAIFIRHRRRVARIAARFFQHRQTVEEVVQEVFTKAYVSLSEYSRDRGPSFAAWISRVAINACYDELRRARRRPEGNLGSFSEEESHVIHENLKSHSGSAESQVISRDLADKLLSRLSAEDRLILTLLDGEEMSVAEIAKSMGWGASRVKVRAHRARTALRKIICEFV